MSGPWDRPSQDRDPSASEQDSRREHAERGSRPADPWRSNDLWPEQRPGAGSGWDDWSSLPPPNDFVSDEPIRTFSDPWAESWADEAAAVEPPPPAASPAEPPTEPPAESPTDAPVERWPEPEIDREPAEPADAASAPSGEPEPVESDAEPWHEPTTTERPWLSPAADEGRTEWEPPVEPQETEEWRPAEPWREEEPTAVEETTAWRTAPEPPVVDQLKPAVEELEPAVEELEPAVEELEPAPEAAGAPEPEPSALEPAGVDEPEPREPEAADEAQSEPSVAWSRSIGLDEPIEQEVSAPHVAPWSPTDDPWGTADAGWEADEADADAAAERVAEIDEEADLAHAAATRAEEASVSHEAPSADEAEYAPAAAEPPADEEPTSRPSRIDGWRRDFLPSWLTGRGAPDAEAEAAIEEPAPQAGDEPTVMDAILDESVETDVAPADAWSPAVAADEAPGASERGDEHVVSAGPIAWEDDRGAEVEADEGDPGWPRTDVRASAALEPQADREEEEEVAPPVDGPADPGDSAGADAPEGEVAAWERDPRPWASREPELGPDRYVWLEQPRAEDDLEQPAWSPFRRPETTSDEPADAAAAPELDAEARSEPAAPVVPDAEADAEADSEFEAPVSREPEPEPWMEPTELDEPVAAVEESPYRRGAPEPAREAASDWLPDLEELDAEEIEERTRVLPTSWAPPSRPDDLEPVDRSALAPHAAPSRTRPAADLDQELEEETEPEATAAEQAVPWLIGFILLLAGMVIVLLALIFAGDGSLGGSMTSPEPSLVAGVSSPSPTPAPSTATPATSATPAPSQASAAPTTAPPPAPAYGPLEMVYQGRAAALAPIYLLHREFTTESEPEVLAQDPNLDVRRFAWSSDGTHGAGLYSDLLVSIEPGTEKRQLADGISSITFSPDGADVLAVRVTRDGLNDVAAVLRITFASGDATEVARITYRRPDLAGEDTLREAQFEDEGGAIRLFWMENNRLRLWVLGAGVWEIDPADGTVTEPGPGLPALWSPDGTNRIVVTEEDGTTTLTRLDVDGVPHESATIEGLVSHVRWSPDSDRVVFTCGRSGSGGGVIQNLYLWDLADGVEPTQITDTGAAFGAEWLGARVRWRDDVNAS